MRIVMESIFDVLYLITVTSMGIYLMKNAKDDKISRQYGIMAVLLGAGDAFHLIPRISALISARSTGDIASAFIKYEVSMGFGKAVTSITMTIFYLMLYDIWKKYYKVENTKKLTNVMYGLGAIRIIIGLLPQNQWLVYNQPLDWGIYRNIPFAIMGIIMIVIFYRESRKHNDTSFKWMWLGILLSFGFYAPVVLWSHINESIGLLMIPKTIAYVWIIWMGLKNFQTSRAY